MKYMGSKRRIVKDILPIILKGRIENQYFVDLFCGGCNVVSEVTGKRIANDANRYVVSMWRSMVDNGWMPPDIVTEDQYNQIKKNKFLYKPYVVGFVGVCLSFGSKWFGGYARNKRGTNFAIEGRKSLLKQIERLHGVEFSCYSYNAIVLPENSIVYCDKPYENTSKYKDNFNNVEFWEWARTTSKNHKIFISEYSAPDDFVCVYQKDIQSNMDAVKMSKSTEKLFIHKSQL